MRLRIRNSIRARIIKLSFVAERIPFWQMRWWLLILLFAWMVPLSNAVAAEGRVLCEHGRIIERSHGVPGRTVYDWRHYLAVVQRKPGALRNGAPFAELPDAFRQLQGQLLKRPGGDREMVEILALVLQHDEQAVLCAVELALEAGVATKTHVINVLHRLTDGKVPPAPPLDAPQALRLTREPVANVERYDDLRDRGQRHAS